MSLTTHASDHDRAIIPNAKEQSPLLELLKSDAAHILENRLESLGFRSILSTALVYPFVEFNAQPPLRRSSQAACASISRCASLVISTRFTVALAV